ncbi:McrC family protein [Actinomadura rugatobispora]|uniref:McrC family protein n=1 Tax=Actinomadura rugatobispora TaxID=1994 RepID=A0ABW1A436_9ACTN|nr:McrBC 5-methylcytosine restriction system component [Actinomadura rugatobispora]
MITVRLRESGGWQGAELTAAQATALSASELVLVAPGPRPGLWRLRDNRRVGAAAVGPARQRIQLRVEPKIAIDRLFFLLGYARKPQGWRQEEVDAGEHDELLPALAYAFARAADRALRQGVLLGYRETEEASHVVRGRIRVPDQMRRRYGFPVPIEVRYDDYTVDIAENRLLLGAAHRLLRMPGVSADIRRLLRHLLVRLDGVTRLVPGLPSPHWTPNRLNARYHTALGLADLVLRGASYELDDGTAVRVDGLMLEMWRVFEDFLTVALAEELRAYGGGVRFQDGRHHLDRARQVGLRPDLVYVSPDGNPGAVVDAKYKHEDSPGGHPADLYQMLAYCTVMGLRTGHLVYAAGFPSPYVHDIAGTGGVRIVETALDLSLPSERLLAQVRDLAQEIAGRQATGTTVSP